MVGELVPYKRPELAVEAFHRMRANLVVIGGGEILAQIQRLAGPTVTVLGPPLSGCGGHCQPCWMSGVSDGAGSVWPVVLERFERHAPAGVMARMALEHALPAGWVDEVFEAHRQKQYSRELLFSTVVELTTLVSLGLRPSLHAAARQMPTLPVSLGSLYDKVNHTEPGILRALVRGSAERLAPVMAALSPEASLPGWRVRVLDGNHLPASEKRLAPLLDSAQP